MSATKPGAAKHAGWPFSVDAILDGDHAVMLAYATPAGGVVLAPLSNFGLHDREAERI